VENKKYYGERNSFTFADSQVAGDDEIISVRRINQMISRQQRDFSFMNEHESLFSKRSEYIKSLFCII
jgi:hypothetical protein